MNLSNRPMNQEPDEQMNDLLDEALAPDSPPADLADRIIAQTSPSLRRPMVLRNLTPTFLRLAAVLLLSVTVAIGYVTLVVQPGQDSSTSRVVVLEDIEQELASLEPWQDDELALIDEQIELLSLQVELMADNGADTVETSLDQAIMLYELQQFADDSRQLFSAG